MNTALAFIERVNVGITKVLGGAMALLLAAMAFIVVLSVVFRYVLNDSLTWSEELIRYMDAWLVFMGLAVAHRIGGHVRITLLFDLTPARFRRLPEAFSEAIVLILLLVIAYFGTQLVLANFDRNQMTPALRIPIAWVYLAVPLGVALMALQSLERLLRLLAGRELPTDPSLEDVAT